MCGESRKMLLHRFESLVHCFSQISGDCRQRNHRKQRENRELDVDAKHEKESEQPARDGVHEIHHCRSGGHSHGAEVVRETRHDVAGTRASIVRRVELLEMDEEIVAQVVLDVSADSVQYFAHSVAHEARENGDCDDIEGECPRAGNWLSSSDGVDAKSQEPGYHTCDCRGHYDKCKPGNELPKVRAIVG